MTTPPLKIYVPVQFCHIQRDYSKPDRAMAASDALRARAVTCSLPCARTVQVRVAK